MICRPFEIRIGDAAPEPVTAHVPLRLLLSVHKKFCAVLCVITLPEHPGLWLSAAVPRLTLRCKVVSVEVSLRIAGWCVLVRDEADTKCGKAHEIRRFSHYAALLRVAAESPERFLSPARLPIPPLPHSCGTSLYSCG